MPYYEYRCQDCGRKVRYFFTYEEYDTAEPTCTNCGSKQVQRLISRVALAKSEESRMDAMDPEKMMAGLDEDDPQSMGRFMRQMSSEMGEDMGDEFNEVVGRLESGESPEAIEESMPELAAGGDDLGGASF
jgi:putative FmdB family regulatory protein